MARIIVGKNHIMIDEPMHIRLTECTPSSRVDLTAEMSDDEGKLFYSYASYMTDENGEVDSGEVSPIDGTYQTPDASALVWSMINKELEADDYFVKKSDDDLHLKLVLKEAGRVVDENGIIISFKSDEVEEIAIEDDRIIGRLYASQKEEVYPAVMILSGSDGGNEAHAASFLASRGYLVLALSYFNDEGLSRDLKDIDLEYFRHATEFLEGHGRCNGDVHLVGYSKGAELALLLGATFNDYKTIVAGAPSNMVTSGMKDGVFAPFTGWRLDGEEIPYMKMRYSFKAGFSSLKSWVKKEPMEFLSIWDRTLEGKGLEESRIDVQSISCPIMLLSGGADALWPSQTFADDIMYERDNSSDQHLHYEEAGHFLSFPYNFHQLPANVHMKIGRTAMSFGGTKKANAEAAKHSLGRILEFIDANG